MPSFCYHDILAYFSFKWVNINILVVLGSSGNRFDHFRRLSKKSKKMKFSMTTCMSKIMPFLLLSHFCIFLIQMSKYLHFSCSQVNWWWFWSFEKIFQKVVKMEAFDDRGQVENMPFLLHSHFSIFLMQMSKYLHFSCPEVNCWWFSSF